MSRSAGFIVGGAAMSRTRRKPFCALLLATVIAIPVGGQAAPCAAPGRSAVVY